MLVLTLQNLPNLLNFVQTDVSIPAMLVNLVLAFGIGLTIAYVYQKTHAGLSYSRPFLSTLVLMCVLGTVVMLVVSQNFIGAFALLGAFALIRFRTILKETRDIAFVFFALVEGVAVGTGNYMVAIVTTAFVSAAIFILEQMDFGKVVRGDYLLTVVAEKPHSLKDWGHWTKHFKRITTLHIKSLGQNQIEHMFDVTLVDPRSAAEIITLAQSTPGIEHVELVSGDSSAGY